jgi:hypothetical protein
MRTGSLMTKLWGWFGLIAGAILAALAWSFAPALADTLSRLGMPPSVTSLLDNEPLVRFALAATLFTLGLLLVGLVLPLLGVRRELTALANKVQAVSAPLTVESLTNALWSPGLLASGLGAWTARLDGSPEGEGETVIQKVTGGASLRMLTPARLYGRALHATAMGLLAPGLAFLGLLLLGTGIIFGLNGQLLGIAPSTGMESPSLLIGLRAGIAALVLCLGGALILWLLRSLAVTAASQGVATLTDALDAVLPRAASSAGPQIGRAVAQALAPTLDGVRAAADQLGQSQAQAVDTVIQQALNSFIAQLTALHGDQLKALGIAAEKLRKSVETASSHMKSADAEAAKKFSESVSAIQAASKAQADGVLDNINRVAGETLNALKASAETSVSTSQALVDALSRETEGARTLGQSAAEIAAAAKVSRETVERFIALAERMRDLHISIASTPVQVAEGPLADPETTRRLSTAIRDLRKAATEALPEL